MLITNSTAPAQIARSAATRSRSWISWAIGIINHPDVGPVDPPLIRVPCPELEGVELYIKDETQHPTGSLKHRLAHALFLHALCCGLIDEHSTIVEASSGSTAISEAWFAAKLGLRFVAVVPGSTTEAKLDAIMALGGEVCFTPAGEDVRTVAARVALEREGHFMDQFANAAEVTDWRGANNIADTLFAQMRAAELSSPVWIVVGAGTGGTSSTIGRYIRLRPELAAARLCVVDPEGSAFFRAYASGDWTLKGCSSPVVEGIGRAQVEPSFNPALIDQMIAVADAGSVACCHWLQERIGRMFGPSTGTNIAGALMLGQSMARAGLKGNIVTLACDRGERYGRTIYDREWLEQAEIDLHSWTELLRHLGTEKFPDAPLYSLDLAH